MDTSKIQTLEEYINEIKEVVQDDVRKSQAKYCELYQIVKQIVSILKYLHKKNIAHGSLCAQNFLVQRIFDKTLGEY